MMNEISCNRCGQCCFTMNDEGVPTKHRCKALVRLGKGKTLCRLYSSRIGLKIGSNNRCGYRENIPINFKGCPYNKLGLPEYEININKCEVVKMKEFNKENLPSDGWKTYKKKVLTKAIKIDGEFTVNTSEGPLHCKDGYLATDARGYPYPIATDEFSLIYDEVKEPKEVKANVAVSPKPLSMVGKENPEENKNVKSKDKV